MNVGAVGALRYVKSAVAVARYVLEHTEHTLLVGSQASKFAYEMGFAKESLATNNSATMWAKWQARKCQPNYWVVSRHYKLIPPFCTRRIVVF